MHFVFVLYITDQQNMFFLSVLLLRLLLMDVSLPKSYNHTEVLVTQVYSLLYHWFYGRLSDKVNLSQAVADDDDYENSAGLSVYGNI